MHDFRCTNAIDMFYEESRKPVKHFKETEGGRSQMCKAMEERIDRERVDERREVLYKAIKNLMQSMKLSAEQAMEAMDISAEDKDALRKKF